MANSSNPNAQRADVKNPNNPAYVADRSNRIQQGHPNVPPPPATTEGAPNTTPTTTPKK
jgi:hypothetical protein